MLGWLFLLIGLVSFRVGMTNLSRYRRSRTHDPSWLGTSVLGFLGSAVNLVAAAVSFARLIAPTR
jgi:hypothetical protein